MKKHTFTDSTISRQPTCTEPGEEKGYCNGCSKNATNPIPALGHDYGAWTIKTAPTMTKTGTTQRVCGNDDSHKETLTLAVLTDDTVWTKDDAKHVDPTEDAPGKDVYTSEYGEVEVTLDKLPHTHNWGDWTITTPSTETKTGTAERTCSKDSEHNVIIKLPALSDTTVWTKDDIKHVDPTEESTGKDVKIILTVEDATESVFFEDKAAVLRIITPRRKAMIIPRAMKTIPIRVTTPRHPMTTISRQTRATRPIITKTPQRASRYRLFRLHWRLLSWRERSSAKRNNKLSLLSPRTPEKEKLKTMGAFALRQTHLSVVPFKNGKGRAVFHPRAGISEKIFKSPLTDMTKGCII